MQTLQDKKTKKSTTTRFSIYAEHMYMYFDVDLHSSASFGKSDGPGSVLLARVLWLAQPVQSNIWKSSRARNAILLRREMQTRSIPLEGREGPCRVWCLWAELAHTNSGMQTTVVGEMVWRIPPLYCRHNLLLSGCFARRRGGLHGAGSH